MRSISDSDVFHANERECNSINAKIKAVINNEAPGLTIVNNKIQASLVTLRATFKDTIVRDACTAIANGELKLYVVDTEYRMPTSMPFFKYSKNGKISVAVDLTSYVRITKHAETGENIYNIDIKKLYVLIVCGYVQLKALDSKAVIPPRVAETFARIWSEMVCKLLASEIGLATNPDRYDAFMYYCSKFFCRYYLETPENVAENVGRSILKKLTRRSINPVHGEDDRGPFVMHMEQQIENRNINIYESLNVFLTTMFNNEITGVKPSRLSDRGRALDFQWFVTRWMKTYDYGAYYGLAAFPYMVFVVIGAFNNAYMVNDRILEPIVAGSHARDTASALTELYAMCR